MFIEDAFHATLKKQVKTRRSQMKKLMVEQKSKMEHIRQDHWLNLSKLMTLEHKKEEAQKLTKSHATVKKPSSVGQTESEMQAKLVH